MRKQEIKELRCGMLFEIPKNWWHGAPVKKGDVAMIVQWSVPETIVQYSILGETSRWATDKYEALKAVRAYWRKKSCKRKQRTSKRT